MRLLPFFALISTSCAFSPIIRLSLVPQVFPSRVSTRLAVASSSTEEISSDTKQPDEASNSDCKIRPLHQNWWPVTATYALDPSRPNPVELLSMKLVLFRNSAGEWKCLQDRCAHRFAPLSEGRIVETKGGKSCLQCAYHGWEFGDDGSCQKVPQAESLNTKPVQPYPVRVEAGMVFVWADPDTSGDSIPIPTFPLLDQWVEARGENSCFMRDLPYGYELLAENLLDLAHLPFSHHGVGGKFMGT
jgi:pheophorbide a oxygenase